MSATGGSNRIRTVRAAAIATLIAAFALALAGEARALSPPEAAQIVFSNGGRLVKVDADGSDRRVLTREGQEVIPGGRTPIGDRFPRVSPGGSKVLFVREESELDPESEPLIDGRNMLLNLATGSVREVLPATKRVRYENLAWLPGTSRVLASKTTSGNHRRTSVVSIGLDGKGERTILRFRPYKGGLPDSNFEASGFAASPDGKSFLMETFDYWTVADRKLELVDLATGKRKVVSKSAHSPAWAPDGKSFVFVRDRKGSEVCSWAFECVPSGDLYTAQADGSGVAALTDTQRDEAHPSFSPDGSRIVFSGTVHRKLDRSTAELFSMPAAGGCASGLTNGSPASLDPAFVPNSGEILTGITCGVDLPALAEARLNPVWKKGFGKRLWLGPVSSQGMLSMEADIVFLSFAVYDDCPSLLAENCDQPGAMVGTSPVCFDMGNWASNLQEMLISGVEKRRGVWTGLERRKGGLIETTVYSGRRTTTISGAESPLRRGVSKLGVDAQRALVGELRVEGQAWKPRLPRLKIPIFDYKLARKVEKLVRLTSIAEVMRANDVGRRWVIDQLNFEANLKRLGGDFGKTRCPDTSDPWDFDR